MYSCHNCEDCRHWKFYSCWHRAGHMHEGQVRAAAHDGCENWARKLTLKERLARKA